MQSRLIRAIVSFISSVPAFPYLILRVIVAFIDARSIVKIANYAKRVIPLRMGKAGINISFIFRGIMKMENWMEDRCKLRINKSSIQESFLIRKIFNFFFFLIRFFYIHVFVNFFIKISILKIRWSKGIRLKKKWWWLVKLEKR